MKEKYLECQTLDWRVNCPTSPVNQHIILKIVGFQQCAQGWAKGLHSCPLATGLPAVLEAVLEAVCKSMVEAEGAPAQMAKVRGTSNYNGQFAPICSAIILWCTLTLLPVSPSLSLVYYYLVTYNVWLYSSGIV